MIPVHIAGLFYAIFYLKEVKVKKEIDKDNKEVAAYDNAAMDIEITAKNNTETLPTTNQNEKNSSACAEFFDPQLAIGCIRSFLKKRENGLRTIIILIMTMHFMMNGVSQGEAQNLFLYVRAKLSWDVDTYVYHNVFTIVAGLIGTTLAVTILSKLFKMADIFLVLISTIMSAVCRVFYVLATTKVSFFVGTAVDFMFSLKLLGVRSIISKIVPSDDLSTMFAIMGLFEALSGFIFPWVYPTFYQYLLTNKLDVSQMFELSGVLFLLAFFVYL